MLRLLKAVFVLMVIAACGAAWWIHQPLELASGKSVDLAIEPGTLPRQIAQIAVDSGVRTDARLLYWWFRFSGHARDIKAGNYQIDPGTTPRTLLSKLARGEEALRAVTLVEGWNFRQVRQALAKADDLKGDTQALGDDAIMQKLDRPGVFPEGRFFPDTYTYSKGSSDLAVLRRAMRAMDKKLDAAWAQRRPDTPLKSMDEALILASIVEKETGVSSDRPQVAAVFVNRLKIGMPLQTDPTVIYGMGTSFDGNLRRRDLQTDTPYNTYLRGGLPPTPISMPGRGALLASVQPAQSNAIYFVSRGDGSSQFSSNLDDHNRAVNRYQRGQR